MNYSALLKNSALETMNHCALVFHNFGNLLGGNTQAGHLDLILLNTNLVVTCNGIRINVVANYMEHEEI